MRKILDVLRSKRNRSTFLLGGTILSIFLFTGCSHATATSIHQNSSFTPQDAIKKYKSKYVSDFPDQPGKWDIVYRAIGGPNRKILLQVETLVAPDGDDAYILTFKETWNASDFNPNSIKKQVLSHESKVRVTPSSIVFLSESGDQEPDFP